MSDYDMSETEAPDRTTEAIVPYGGGGAAALNRSEVECQLSAAHQYRRSIKGFLSEAVSLATLTVPVAESCMYAIPRDGKTIAGPSVRLAEIIASAYGNLHVGARIVDVEDREVVAQGVAWDLEKNLRVSVETRRRITTKTGRRFSDDMITVTGNAAASIALRNAIFRVVPRAYVDTVYEQVRRVAVGSAATLSSKRTEVLLRLGKLGATQERVLGRLGRRAELGSRRFRPALERHFRRLPSDQHAGRVPIDMLRNVNRYVDHRPGRQSPELVIVGDAGSIVPLHLVLHGPHALALTVNVPPVYVEIRARNIVRPPASSSMYNLPVAVAVVLRARVVLPRSASATAIHVAPSTVPSNVMVPVNVPTVCTTAVL